MIFTARKLIRNPLFHHRLLTTHRTMSASTQLDAQRDITYINANTAREIDEVLMSPGHGFSIESLMEQAGLSCAQALHDSLPPAAHKKVLVIAGPGNNGGDGLVAARHLVLMDYSVSICYPKQTDKDLYNRLVAQCSAFSIPFVEWSPELLKSTDIVLDAIFGFSFSGQTREPFASIIAAMSEVRASGAKIVSIDIPSGWHVEQGDTTGTGIRPDVLVSLTAPKEGARGFSGIHYLCGRFVSPLLASRFSLHLPQFPGSATFVRLDANTQEADLKNIVADMRISYERGGIDEVDFYNQDPIGIFKKWFDEACLLKASIEPNWIALASSSGDRRPSVRAVLLKGFDERGFTIYTNYESRKGQELISNPHCSFMLYWEALQRQIRVEGVAEKLSPEESNAYFSSRPPSSQIGALVSNQSREISSRAEIEARDAELKAKYADETPIPRPSHWGGFVIRPLSIEFWQGRVGRLHDRIKISRKTLDDEWDVPKRLQP